MLWSNGVCNKRAQHCMGRRGRDAVVMRLLGPSLYVAIYIGFRATYSSCLPCSVEDGVLGRRLWLHPAVVIPCVSGCTGTDTEE